MAISSTSFLNAFCQGLEWKRVGVGNGLFTAAIVTLAFPPCIGLILMTAVEEDVEASRVRNLCPSVHLSTISATFCPPTRRKARLFPPSSTDRPPTAVRQSLLHLSPQLFISRLSRRKEKRKAVCDTRQFLGVFTQPISQVSVASPIMMSCRQVNPIRGEASCSSGISLGPSAFFWAPLRTDANWSRGRLEGREGRRKKAPLPSLFLALHHHMLRDTIVIRLRETLPRSDFNA